jgi:carboxypeptidase T
MTTEVAMDLIDQLMSGYALNAKVQKWVKNTEIWVVPMVNPDGNNKVWTSNNLWRKNAHGGYGVDINRNYPYAWASCEGSSSSTYADDYHGESAASEPETKAMMGLVAKILPAMSISYHSYSELVIYPFGCDGQRTPDHETVEKIGSELAKTMKKDSGNGTYDPGTAWELLYAVDGGDIDWYYNEHHVLPFVIEVNSGTQGFQPPYSWRQKTVEKVRASWGYMLDRAQQSGIKGRLKANSLMASSGYITVRSLKTEESVNNLKTYKIKRDGTFNIVIDPGMYRVTIHAGTKEIEQDVTVGAERLDISSDL